MVDYKYLAENYWNVAGIGEPDWMQFNHCQAWVTGNDYYDEKSGTYFGLMRSYNTIVAIVDYSRKKFVRLGKWSTTTSKQSTQIHNALYPDYEDIQL